MTKSSGGLVSVIIPAYNAGHLLAYAIESALRQTYQPVEIIVVNDGSTSSATRETAERYAHRVTYIEQNNAGVAAARNTALAVAKGEFIALLDADDVWLPAKLALQVPALETLPRVGLVHSSYYYIDYDGMRTGQAHLHEGEWRPLPRLLLEMPISPSTAVLRREVAAEIGPLDSTMNGADDWEWFLRLALRGYNFYSVGRPLAEYRRHKGGITRNFDLMVRSWLRMLDVFYARTDLPAEAVRMQDRAYFARHTDAAALYFGVGNLGSARTHLQSAARYFPDGLASGRLLQSLIYSRCAKPSLAEAHAAISFVEESLEGSRLPPRVLSRLRARSALVLALHARSATFALKHAALALRHDPLIPADREVWAAARRSARKITARLKSGILKAPRT